MEPVRAHLLVGPLFHARGSFLTDQTTTTFRYRQVRVLEPNRRPDVSCFPSDCSPARTERVVDMVKSHIEAAKDDHAVALASALYGNGSLAAPTPSSTVDDTAVLGGIDPTSKTWWKSTVQAPTAGTDIRLALRSLSNAIMDASGRKADIVIAGADAFDAYEASLDDAIRYNALSTGDSRFRELRFDGLAIRRDGVDCPADKVFMLRRDALVAKSLKGYFMKPEAAQFIPGTLTEVIPMASMLLFGTNERRAHGKLTFTA